VGAVKDLLVVDTSAYHRAGHPDVVQAWQHAIVTNRVGMAPPAKLEILYSARSATDYAEVAEELRGFHHVPCGEDAWERALEVQAALARQHAPHHRSVQAPDLLIAAAAELAGAAVWHYDSDYDRIADITGQATEWIVPKGSI
jgi:predicted nucleic acid-binding protein